MPNIKYDLLLIIDNITNSINLEDFNNIDINIKNKLFDKICNKINIIKLLCSYNLVNYELCENIKFYNEINSLMKLNNSEPYIIYKKISKQLGYIIYTSYRNSEYHILLSNIPCYAVSNICNNGIEEIVNSEAIFDTLNYCMGIETVELVLQISPSNYLVKFISYNDSKILCKSIDKHLIGNNIIKAELLFNNDSIGETITDKKITNKQSICEQINDDHITYEHITDDQIINSIDKIDNNIENITSTNNLLVIDLLKGVYNKVFNIVNYFYKIN